MMRSSILLLLIALLVSCSAHATHRHQRRVHPSLQQVRQVSQPILKDGPTDVWGDVTSSNLCYANNTLYIAVSPPLSTISSTIWMFDAKTHERLPGEIAFNSTIAIIQIFCSPSTRSIFALTADVSKSNEELYVQQRNVDTGQLVTSFLLNEDLQVIWSVDPTGQSILSGNLVAPGGISVLDASTGSIKGVYDGGDPNMELAGGAFHPSGKSIILLDANSRSMVGIDIATNKPTLNYTLPDDIALYGSLVVDPRAYCAWVIYGTDNPFSMPFWNRLVQYELSSGKQLLKLEFDVPDKYAPAQFISASDDSPNSIWWLDQGSYTDASRPSRFVKQNGANNTEYPISSTSSLPGVSGVGILHNGSVVVALSGDMSVRLLSPTGQYVTNQPIDQSIPCQNNKHVSANYDSILVPVNASAVRLYNSDGKLLNNVVLDPSINPWTASFGQGNTIYIIDFNDPSHILQIDNNSGKVIATIGSGSNHFIDVQMDITGMVWAADVNGFILQYTSAGQLLTSWNYTDATATGTVIRSFTIDKYNQYLIVARSSYDDQDLATSTILWLYQSTGTIQSTYTFPHGYEIQDVTVAKDGTVYATGITKNELIVFNPNGMRL